MKNRSYIRDYTHRGERIHLYYDKEEECYVVTSDLLDEEIKAPSGKQQWAVKCARKYIDGRYDAREELN